MNVSGAHCLAAGGRCSQLILYLGLCMYVGEHVCDCVCEVQADKNGRETKIWRINVEETAFVRDLFVNTRVSNRDRIRVQMLAIQILAALQVQSDPACPPPPHLHYFFELSSPLDQTKASKWPTANVRPERHTGWNVPRDRYCLLCAHDFKTHFTFISVTSPPLF